MSKSNWKFYPTVDYRKHIFIFADWDDCKEYTQTHKLGKGKRNCVYKGFNDLDEAYEWAKKQQDFGYKAIRKEACKPNLCGKGYTKDLYDGKYTKEEWQAIKKKK